MVPCTRRRALHGAAGLLAAVAGCSGSSSSSSRSNVPETAENVETDPEHYALRNPREEPAAWIRREEDREGNRESEAGGRSWSRAKVRGLIASRSTAERLSFADVDGSDGARAFVEGTDFDRETLLLDPDRIGECFTLDLCYVTWSATEYHTYYARLYRDADVACSTENRVGVAHLVRIPDALDPEQVTGSGSGVASGGCRAWGRRLERRGGEADAGNSTGRGDADTESATGGQ